MKVRDPVCKMVIEDKDALETTTYMKEAYYFCSEACKYRFETDPLRYLMAGKFFVPPEE
jgi:Cu+-exporting ATPase